MSQDPRAEVIAKALKDPAFRAELLKNPNAAIEKALDVKLTGGATLKVLEDSASVVHLVLPPAQSPEALSDEDLRHVAGGSGQITFDGKLCTFCKSQVLP